MRATLFAVALMAAGVGAPAHAAQPDLSTKTIYALDDRLWAAGDKWREIFDRLPKAQQEALIDLNKIVTVKVIESGTTPPECHEPCETVEEEAEQTAPPSNVGTRKPLPVMDPIVEVEPAPPFECGNKQQRLEGQNWRGKAMVAIEDWMAWCINEQSTFESYSHGHAANAYGWAWQPLSCICREEMKPPAGAGDQVEHSFFSEQTFWRQVGVGDFYFTDHHVLTLRGQVNATGPKMWTSVITGG